MDKAEQAAKSKWLWQNLKKTPEKLGLSPDSGGWVKVDALIAAAKQHGVELDLSQLETLVYGEKKQRFGLSGDKLRFRAAQGQTPEAAQNNQKLPSQMPPDELYFGTDETKRAAIEKNGLKAERRPHVVLWRDVQIAVEIGKRTGKPIVFRVDALQMHNAGFDFFLAENGAWLVEEVPAQFLSAA